VNHQEISEVFEIARRKYDACIYHWIRKYVDLMKSYLEKITPNVPEAWHADELYVKVRGNPKYLLPLMDDQTRFWIAQQVADTKYTSNIISVEKCGIIEGQNKWNTVIENAKIRQCYKKGRVPIE
jgi:hypothetical protein